MRKITFLLVLALALLGLVACDKTTDPTQGEENNPPVEAATVKSISVVDGYKNAYVVGDSLDLSSLKLLVTYSDDTTKEVNVTSQMISAVDMSAAGTKTITVTYEGKTTTFNVIVSAPEEPEVTLQSISIKGSYVTEYSQGDTLILDGMVLLLIYSDNSTEEIAVTQEMLGAVDMSTVGPKRVVVTYKSLTTHFDILVNEKIVSVVKVDPVFSEDNGLLVLTGFQDSEGNAVQIAQSEYTYHYAKDEEDLGAEVPTEPGTYSIVIEFNEESNYEFITLNMENLVKKVWKVFRVTSGETVLVSIKIHQDEEQVIIFDGFVDEEGNDIYIDPSKYSAYYEKSEVEISRDDFVAGVRYTFVVKFNDDSGYKFYTEDKYTYASGNMKLWTKFYYTPVEEGDDEVTKVDVVFTQTDGGIIFGGFVDANGNAVQLNASDYDAHYESNEVNVGTELPTEPGDYALVVELLSENYGFITLNRPDVPHKVWRGFKVNAPSSDDVVKIDVVFTETAEGVVFGGFVDAEGNSVEVNILLYSVQYEQDEVYVGTSLPTEPGTYALVVKLEDDANYEFITLNNPNFKKVVWKVFTVKAPSTGEVVKIDPVFAEENGALVLKGFVDAEGNAVELDSSLYLYEYSKDEVSQGTVVPTEPGTYALSVTLADDANYEFITLNNANLNKHIWKVFTVKAPSTEEVVKVDAVFTETEGGLVFGGFVDAEGNAVELDSSLYNAHYEANEVNVGTELPTTPGDYALVVELLSENYEFITLNLPNVVNKVWRGFAVESNEVTLVKLVTSLDEDNVVIFVGFTDANGNNVVVDPSNYETWYEHNESKISRESFVAGTTYSLIVKFNDGANYQFITGEDHIGNANKAWPYAVYTPVNDSEQTTLYIGYHVDADGVIVFDGFKDANGNAVNIDSSAYHVFYEKSEAEISRENFQAGVRYTIKFKLLDTENYVFGAYDYKENDSRIDSESIKAAVVYFKFYYTPVEEGEDEIIKIDPVFAEENGALVLKGFKDSKGNAVELDSSLYTYEYSKNEVSQGTKVPTEPGTYAIAVTLADDAKYEFITLNNVNLKKHVWKVFTIAAPTVEGTIKIDPVFAEENGALVLKGFKDEKGNAVELDSSLYSYEYSKDEVSQGTAVPTEPGTYALAVTLADDANYEFITLNNANLKKHIWRVFTVAGDIA